MKGKEDRPASGVPPLDDLTVTPPVSAENPQAPETLDASTPKVDTSSFAGMFGEDDQDVVYVDPDRPPVSRSDQRKLKNQLKSKAKKYALFFWSHT